MKLMDRNLLSEFREGECPGALGVARAYAEALPEESLLVLLYAYYHYFKANPDRASQLLAGGQWDKAPEDHRIVGIYPAKEEGLKKGTIDVLLAIYDERMTATALGQEMYRAYGACETFLREIRGTLSGVPSFCEQRLKDLGFERFGEETHPIRIRFLVPFCVNQKDVTTLERQVKERFSVADDVVFGDAIEEEILYTNATFTSVPKGTVLIDRGQNICRHRDGHVETEAFLVNAKAESLRRLYRSYAYRGLLSQNLRYYVKMKRVDSAIDRTLSERPWAFWYLNNGIVIVCDACHPDGDRLELKDFSILNGGQTMHHIGTCLDGQTLAGVTIPCKIIQRPKGMRPEEWDGLVADISEASNTQKPIKSVDAVANRAEQRQLKEYLEKNRACAIFYETKRGQKMDKRAFPEPWQKVSTQVLGQYLCAFFYQGPCTARNKTASLFAEEDLYNQLFRKPFLPVEVIRDLLKLRLRIRQFIRECTKKSVPRDNVKMRARTTLAKNSEYLFVACVGVLCKVLGDSVVEQKVSSAKQTALPGVLAGFDVAYPFLSTEDERSLFPKLTEVLNWCLDAFLLPGYLEYERNKGVSGAYSNFSKADANYLEYVQGLIARKIAEGLIDFERQQLAGAFRQPTVEELEASRQFAKSHPRKWQNF